MPLARAHPLRLATEAFEKEIMTHPIKMLGFAALLTISPCYLLHGQTTPPPGTTTATSVATYKGIVAPDSIAAAWGSNFAVSTIAANGSDLGTTGTLPNTLGGARLTLTDSAGVVLVSGLYMVSPGQINFVVPANAAQGKASYSVVSASGTVTGTILISNVAPGLFTADQSGSGVPAAQVLRVTSGGQATYESPSQSGNSAFLPRSIDLTASPTDKVYVVLYGTGFRRRSLNPVIVTIGGISVPVLYAGAQGQYPGLDQINIGPLPQSLVGLGAADLIVTIDGVPANTVRLAIR